ncbi:MarR family winged helix-turn-helix transcriptional regulator [Streptomyces sp. NPDC102274]|uniref:MarR family winged helix-turn-helix transcriptional regulator n=1 Tax=Streptomyces sp. NPDC102274 TaxID=3366151 RepID=UPI003829FC98
MSRSISGSETGSADGSTRSADAVQGLLSSLLRHAPRDMSLTSLAALSTLNRTGPRRITDLAMVEGITQPSATTLVTTLERAGFVERRSDPDDRRVVLVAITASGSDYLRARRRVSTEVFARLVDELTADERSALAAAIPALRRLRELDEEQRDPGPNRTGV